MSAWIVQNESINNIVNSIYWLKYPYWDKIRILKDSFKIDLEKNNDLDLYEELEKLGQLLINLNQKSVNQRYSTKEKPFIFEYEDKKSSDVFQFLKSVECLLYQSCEGDCEEKEEYKFLTKLRDVLKNKIINDIEEYNKAKWE